MLQCAHCALGLCAECFAPSDGDCCCVLKEKSIHPVLTAPTAPVEPIESEPESIEPTPPAVETEVERSAHSKPYKADTDLKDVKSTGRKRAALLFPLDREKPCEWAGLRFAGGGRVPIVGCYPLLNLKQEHIHHGPNKDTMVNVVGNVFRICTTCHNRWHALNDPIYEWTNVVMGNHDPVSKASGEEQFKNEMWFRDPSFRKKKPQGYAKFVRDQDYIPPEPIPWEPYVTRTEKDDEYKTMH